MNKQVTKIKEAHGVSIYVNSDGRFIAEIGDRVINKSNLRDVEKELGKIAGGIPVIHFNDKFGLVKNEFVGKDPKGGFRDRSGHRRPAHETYYRATPELVSQLEDLEARYNAAMRGFREERYRLLSNAVKISERDFERTATATRSEKDEEAV